MIKKFEGVVGVFGMDSVVLGERERRFEKCIVEVK